MRVDPKTEKTLNEKGLVDITKINKRIKLDLRYATANNMTKRKLYSNPVCFFKNEVAEQLSLVQRDLEKLGLCLIIWDGYRPARIQKFIWEAFPNEKYNAKISSHNRGIAIDCTLGKRNGESLSMPTDLDIFGEQSHHGFDKLPKDIIKNRKILKKTMEKHGFKSFEFEWWHYTYEKLKDSEVIDIPI